MRNRKNGECLVRDELNRKQCRTCDSWQPVSMFSRHKKTLDGLQVRCRVCVNRERIRTQYGVTHEYITSLYVKQNGQCAICRKDMEGKYAVDHDHSCCGGNRSCGGCVRGLLCHLCNLGLGSFKDDLASLQQAVSYLEKHKPDDKLEPHVPYLDAN